MAQFMGSRPRSSHSDNEDDFGDALNGKRPSLIDVDRNIVDDDVVVLGDD